jgi:hypothetical protein
VNRAGRTTAFLLALLPAAASAWTDHASLLWPVVRAMPAMNERSVVVETLEDFLAVEEVGLARLLRDEEQRSRERYAHYAPRPEVLTFTAGAPDARRAFLEAIRVNPSLAYAPYRQRMIDDEDDAGARVLGWSDLTFLAGDDAHESLAYLPLAAGDRVTPAQVLATASDEPDLGIDIGLFEDNGTAHGAALRLRRPALRQSEPRLRLPGALSHGFLPPRLADAHGAAGAAAHLPRVARRLVRRPGPLRLCHRP